MSKYERGGDKLGRSQRAAQVVGAGASGTREAKDPGHAAWGTEGEGGSQPSMS